MSLTIHSGVFFVYYVRVQCDRGGYRRHQVFLNFVVDVTPLLDARRASNSDTVLIKSIKVASRENS
jgi:hypothetical protein